ncbi:hypothetical protein EJ04DRAFT_297511 [Polyplosphaeria fusca]|uniref:Uncharacterized protein n=1 Tax=Polyplosphaeria fusca TaxID=682080 RepID=A0A9P4QWV8_9PLEO|nr:hypothetical protein EJ04DRAFT_297511 [Polyplosphaeria fusca]
MARNAWLALSLSALALLGLVSADVQFTSPSAGGKVTGGGTISIEWKDSGDEPKISELLTYQIFLCAGGNTDDTMDQLIELTSSATTANTFAITGNKFTGTVGATIGGTGTNAYFLKMISVAQAGGTVMNYSPRFTLSGMTGTFSAKVQTALKDVKGTDGPPTVNNVNDPNNAPADPANGDFDMAYTAQTGATRYAPMQPVPPTQITKKVQTPLFATSSVDIARTPLARPKQQTTVTQSQTFKVSSMENTVAAAAMPSDDMAKFLARWKD